MTKRSTLGWGAVAALALTFIGLTIVFNYSLAGWQLDLTQNRLYTISSGTDRILQGIKEPIDLYFFYSAQTAESIPQIRPYGQRVSDFLQELTQRSDGMIHLHVIDPKPFSVDEDRASELGVTGTDINDAGTKFYFGLAGTNSTNGQQAIPFFDPSKQSFLEYDVAKLVYELAHPAKPVVAWLSTLPMTGGYDPQSGQMRQPWTIYSQAEQLFDLRPLQPTATSIAPDVRVLVLVDPKNLSPATQYAIDQYALRGGHIVAFVDPVAEMDQSAGNPMQAMTADRASHMEKLLTAWGVDFNPGEVVADRGHALTVAMREGQPPVEHLGILGLGKSSLSQSDVITSGLSNVNVDTAGYLTPVKGATVKFEPLIRSSADAEPMPAQRFAMLLNPATLLDGFKPTGTRYTIAARITGMVKTAFPDGPPQGVTLPAGQRDLKASAKPLNLVVFADSDLLSDYLWVHDQELFGQQIAQAWASNGDLVLNTLDNLAGSSDLISIRGRAGFTRPFLRVEALQRVADTRFHAQEQQLQQELQQTEQQLTLLQSKRNDKSALILTPQQQQEIEHFEAEKLQIRKQLRAVQAGLVSDIDKLGTELKFIDIILMPAVFALGALLIAALRRRRPPLRQGFGGRARLRQDSGGRARRRPEQQGSALMTARRVTLLFAIGIVIIALAAWMSNRNPSDGDSIAGTAVLPGLESSLNDVTQVRITKAGNVTTTLDRKSTDWLVGERDYPADSGKLRKLLLDLGSLKAVERKTSIARNYPVLGVDDVTSPNASGARIDIISPGKTWSLLVGHSIDGNDVYVRVVDSSPSLLATPLIMVDADPKLWLDSTVVDIAQTRVSEVDEQLPKSAPFSVSRPQTTTPDFTVHNLPHGRELASPDAADQMSSALSALTLTDVRKPTPPPPGTDLSHAVFKTFDGLEIDVSGYKQATTGYIDLSARATTKATAAEAQQINSKVQSWDYEIPDYRYDEIFQPMDGLLKPLPAKKPPKAHSAAARK